MRVEQHSLQALWQVLRRHSLWNLGRPKCTPQRQPDASGRPLVELLYPDTKVQLLTCRHPVPAQEFATTADRHATGKAGKVSGQA